MGITNLIRYIYLIALSTKIPFYILGVIFIIVMTCIYGFYRYYIYSKHNKNIN